jgi:hypothetical protein
MTRQAATKHLALLVSANLVVPLWRGRGKYHYLNPAPLKQINEQWIAKYEKKILPALRDLQRGLDEIDRPGGDRLDRVSPHREGRPRVP